VCEFAGLGIREKAKQAMAQRARAGFKMDLILPPSFLIYMNFLRSGKYASMAVGLRRAAMPLTAG
ncbi:MAG: hypothetical protein ACLPND_07475, partial [Candidatus Korobacteraceae bacterium]